MLSPLTRATGRFRTRSGETYDYEATPRFSVEMKATDGHGGDRSIPVSIDLTDLNEPPVFYRGRRRSRRLRSSPLREA